MKILVQFPTYQRGNKFLDVLGRFARKLSGEHVVYFNINCDATDLTMTNEYVQKRVEYYSKAYSFGYKIHYDLNTDKIGACNAHIPEYGWDIVMILSDDMVPQVKGWDDEVAKAMEEHYPGLDGCVYFNDGSHSAKDLITLSIVGRELYRQFGYLYHPDYKSLYCDTEFTEVMKYHGKAQYVDKKIITHEHYSIEGSENYQQTDVATQKTLFYSGRDQRVYEERKRRGFPRERITHD